MLKIHTYKTHQRNITHFSSSSWLKRQCQQCLHLKAHEQMCKKHGEYVCVFVRVGVQRSPLCSSEEISETVLTPHGEL